MREVRESANDVDGRPMNPEDIIDQKIKKAAELRAVPKEQRLKLAYQSELQGGQQMKIEIIIYNRKFTIDRLQSTSSWLIFTWQPQSIYSFSPFTSRRI